MTREKKLFKQTIIYAIGNFGSKAINIILLPFYTNVLTQAQYGSVDIVLTTLILLTPFVSVNMGEAVFRFSVDKNYNKEQVLNVGLLVSLIGLFVLALFIPIVNMYLKNITLVISFIVLIFIYVYQSIFKQYVRAIEKLNIYMVSDFIQVIAFVGLVLLFVGKYEMGVLGFVYAKISALFIDLIFLITASKAYRALRDGVNLLYAKEMLRFGAPLIPNSVLWWISNTSDRYLLSVMVGLSSVGIYSVATKFPIILAQMSSVFFKSWQTSAIDQDSAKDSSAYHTKIFNGYAVVLFLIASSILVVIKPLMIVLVSIDFYDAWKYTPFLLLGSVFSALAGFLGINYNVAKDTKKALFSTILAAVINIILNLLLIPYYSIMGASIATLISFAVLLAIRMYETPQYKDIKFNYILLTSFTVLFVIQSVALFTIESNIYQIIFQTIIFSCCVFTAKKCI
ncbi:lipopolysaccharide biosynthesis protein [Photobacterium leiognathi subsp. mandapamensis]